MSNKPSAAIALCSALIIAGCTTQPTQEQSGMVVGGLLGGLRE